MTGIFTFHRGITFLVTLIWAVCAQPAWPQEKGYLQIARDYEDAGMKLFAGEIYRCEKRAKNSSWIIHCGNVEIKLPYNEKNPIYNYLYEESEALANEQQALENKVGDLIKKQIISNRQRYLFDVKSIKSSQQIIRFASNKNEPLRFENRDNEIIEDLDKTFPDEYIRLIVPQTPTVFIAKEDIKNSEPVYDFDREKFNAYKGKDGQIYLQQKKDARVIRTDPTYSSSQAVYNMAIELGGGKVLDVDHRGIGVISEMTDANFMTRLWRAVKSAFWAVIVIVFLAVILFYALKNASRSKRDGVPMRRSFSLRRFLGLSSSHRSSSHRDQPPFQSREKSIQPLQKLPASKTDVPLPQTQERTSAASQKPAPSKPDGPLSQPQERSKPIEKEAALVAAPARHEFRPAEENLENRFKQLEEKIAKIVSDKMLGLENRLIKNHRMQEENDDLRRQVGKLEQSVNAYSQTKISIERELMEKNNELAKMQQELAEKNREIANFEQAASRFDELTQYIYRLDGTDLFLKPHLEFFSQLAKVENKVGSLLSHSAQENGASADSDCLRLIWSKYAMKKIEIQLARWELLLNGMRDRGLITDREVIRRIKGEKTEELKWKNLNELLYKEAYRPWLSGIFVLLEEVRNLGHFTKDAQSRIAAEARNFDKEIRALRNQAEQSLELTVHYVPLFEDYTQYSNINIKAVDEPVYPFYKDLPLARNSIFQVISYGLKSNYGNEPTTVILAK